MQELADSACLVLAEIRASGKALNASVAHVVHVSLMPGQLLPEHKLHVAVAAFFVLGVRRGLVLDEVVKEGIAVAATTGVDVHSHLGND